MGEQIVEGIERDVESTGSDEDWADGDGQNEEKADRGGEWVGREERRADETAPRSVRLQTIIDMAPFIDEDPLSEMLEDCDWSGATISQL